MTFIYALYNSRKFISSNTKNTMGLGRQSVARSLFSGIIKKRKVKVI